MRVDSEFFEFLRIMEGFKKTVYIDSGGERTIGIGHLLTRSELASGYIIIKGKATKYAEGLTNKQVYDLCRQDTAKTVKYINENVYAYLTQNQFNALVSFVFNIGLTAFKHSTLRRKLNKGNHHEVPDQLKRWVYDNGVVVKGLKNRRDSEIYLWNKDSFI